MPEIKVGELLIANGLITREQFHKAMEVQQFDKKTPIGQILCHLGYLTADHLSHVLDFNNKRIKLGEILVQQKLIDPAKMENALTISRDEKIPLGKALLRLHYIEEEQLARSIATQQDLPFVTLKNREFAPELAQFISASFAMRHLVVPIEKKAAIVTLAMAYPLGDSLFSELKALSKCQIVKVIARESDIVHAQEKIYGVRKKIILDSSESIHLDLVEDFLPEENRSKYVLDYNVDNLLKKLLATGVRAGASDIHLENTDQGLLVRFRIDGVLQTVNLGEAEELVASHGRPIVSKIKILCDLDITEKRRPQDGSFRIRSLKDGVIRNVDFRVSIVPSKLGENLVIRILDKIGPMSMETLGLSPWHIDELQRLLVKPTGIFLVTGPTGSGKSSTLYALLGKLNHSGVKTLTVEDPIEYSIDGVSQSEVNEAIGNTFAKFLRAFLRQDPDHIMVGEIRDLETASVVIRAAMTGHTVLSTLHTNDSTSSVPRLIDMGIDPTLVSTTLRCVLAQRLTRKICGVCHETYQPAANVLAEFLLTENLPFSVQRGKGCLHCNFTGFSGRIPIVELWTPSREDLLLINRGSDNVALREAAFVKSARGSMLEDGLIRVRLGETTLEELLRVVPYEQIVEFRQKFKDRPFHWGVVAPLH